MIASHSYLEYISCPHSILEHPLNQKIFLYFIKSAASSSASGSNSINSENIHIQNSQPWESSYETATDLLLSVLINADTNKVKIFGLASKAVRELAEMASPGSPFWRYDNDKGIEVFDENAYDRKFGSDATLEEVLKMILSGQMIGNLPRHNPAVDIMGNEAPLKVYGYLIYVM